MSVSVCARARQTPPLAREQAHAAPRGRTRAGATPRPGASHEFAASPPPAPFSSEGARPPLGAVREGSERDGGEGLPGSRAKGATGRSGAVRAIKASKAEVTTDHACIQYLIMSNYTSVT